MSIRYDSLDPNVRTFMVQELERDARTDALYYGKYLSPVGRAQWPDLLRQALSRYDDAWLARELRQRGLLLAQAAKKTPSGGVTTAKVPVTAPDMLAEGEFNRFYARGLCASIVASGGGEVEVYRGKEVSNPRPESQAKIGQRLSAQALLNDLRTAQGVEPALGLPPGPNSGLTVRRT